jgi:carbon-monoxide dehydrogenase small subunit
VQQAFQDCHALQCGFGPRGFITTISAYLAENPDPSAEEAREAISGNLCRCTGYQNIVAAVQRAAEIRAAAARTRGAAPGVAGSGGSASEASADGSPGAVSRSAGGRQDGGNQS